MPRKLPAIFVIACVVIALLLVYRFYFRGGDRLIVYCAHDSVYSDAVLRAFEADTGIRVAARYDTEATKSLGLVELLVREKDAPRCDVFWNNEILGTLDLAVRGVLDGYKGAGYARMPDAFRDPEGRWVGFGARLRVYIVNTNRMPAAEAGIAEALAAGDLSDVAIAKPLYGTTLTHYSLLWDRLGPDAVKAWHADLRRRGIVEAPGNGAVKNLVAKGTCRFGFTDTDDYFLAQDAGAPVRMLPIRAPGGGTICIPNTVSIVKGTRRRADAERLVDYLLSEASEIALAHSASRQVPLGPVDPAALPADVRALLPHARHGVPLRDLRAARTACLTWLKAQP